MSRPDASGHEHLQVAAATWMIQVAYEQLVHVENISTFSTPDHRSLDLLSASWELSYGGSQESQGNQRGSAPSGWPLEHVVLFPKPVFFFHSMFSKEGQDLILHTIIRVMTQRILQCKQCKPATS